MPENVVIIGGTSGIGRALAVEMHGRGYTVGVTGRRTQRLQELKQELRDRIFIQPMDISHTDKSITRLERLSDQMGNIDVIVLNAGISNYQEDSGRQAGLKVIDVNIRGFANLASYCFAKFEEQGHGQLVGVSSVASLFGWGLSAAYNASKAFVNIYLQGYRQKANHSEANITVTNLMPGFVESEMTEGRKGMFWVAPAAKAARQIANTIEHRKDHAYITKRWRLVAWLIKLTPQWVWNRM